MGALWSRVLPGVLAALLAAGCVDRADQKNFPIPIDGTMYRVGPYQPTVEKSQLNLEIFTTEKRCRKVFRDDSSFKAGEEFADNEARIKACMPKVDRASGEVHLAFRLTDKEDTNNGFSLPLEKEHIRVFHDGFEAPLYEVTQHEPKKPGQLFILLLDHSGSMMFTDEKGIDRWAYVKKALLGSAGTFVREKGDSQSAVVLLRFNDSRVTGLYGEPMEKAEVITSRQLFSQRIQEAPVPSGGTALYNSVKLAVTALLDNPGSVRDYLDTADMRPTLVVLTDGFNTNAPNTTACKDNADPLQGALNAIAEARKKGPAKRPTVYTVGFGRGFRPGFEPEPDDRSVTPAKLCGDLVNNCIHQGCKGRSGEHLDKLYIDNVSLKWMAQIGGGRGFMAPTPELLEEAFKATAPEEYSWYEVKYKVDPAYHRHSFTTKVRVDEFAPSSSTVQFHPSGWLDAPSGVHTDGAIWFTASPIRNATAVMVPVVSLLILLGYLGASTFNARRAIFRRARKNRRRK